MKILVATFAYNEGVKIRSTLSKFPAERPYDLIVVDDGSSDHSLDDVQEFRAHMLRHPQNLGIGASIKTMLCYALEQQYEIAVIMAGNDKDHADEIPRLIEPIVQGNFDLVQGSRYLPGGKYGNMPFYRRIATQYVHPLLFSLVAGQHMTDTTNGFRAIRLVIFQNKAIDLDQAWLNHYEFEPYLLYKAIKLGYRVTEVPVSKVYPPKALGYTKMKPFSGWWSILRPLVLLGLGIKK